MESTFILEPDESRATLAIAITSSVLGVAFVAVVLRIYTRAFVIKNVGWEDYAAVISFLMAFACGFTMMYSVMFGHGRHIFYLTPMDIQLYLRALYFIVIFYNAGLMAVKATFLIQYWRVLALGWYRKILIAATIIVMGWCVAVILVETFSCSPIRKFWIPETPGRCLPLFPRWYVNAGGNITTDVIVFVLPLPVISKLNLAKGHKVVLLGIFCLGFFTVSISIIRIPYLIVKDDLTWENVELAAWSISEICSGIVCSCLLTFRPLVARWGPRLAARLSHRSSGHTRDDDPIGSSISGKTWPAERSAPPRPLRTPESMDSLYNHLFEDVHRELKTEDSDFRDTEHGEIAIGYAPGQNSAYSGEPMGWVQPPPEQPGVMAHVETHISSNGPVEMSPTRSRSRSRLRFQRMRSDEESSRAVQDMPKAHLRGSQDERIQFY